MEKGAEVKAVRAQFDSLSKKEKGEGGTAHAARHLADDIKHEMLKGKPFVDKHREGDRRIQVAAGNAGKAEIKRRKGKPEGEGGQNNKGNIRGKAEGKHLVGKGGFRHGVGI